MYDPLHCGLFLILAFVLAGLLHSLWLNNRLSQALAIPLDGGRMFRGRPILGENKTLRGFVVMIPAAALAFAAVAIADFSSTRSASRYALAVNASGLCRAWRLGRVRFYGRGAPEFIRQATARHFARASAGISVSQGRSASRSIASTRSSECSPQ